VGDQELPRFEYFPDPVGNGCIVARKADCICCGLPRNHMYVGPIYSVDEIEEICPWCIADGLAAEKLSADFNDALNIPEGIPEDVVLTVCCRTPGYRSWQDNQWLFSATDALIFLGEVSGKQVLDEGDASKTEVCMNALKKTWPDWTIEQLAEVTVGGQPAIYLFQDKETGVYAAYADYT